MGPGSLPDPEKGHSNDVLMEEYQLQTLPGLLDWSDTVSCL